MASTVLTLQKTAVPENTITAMSHNSTMTAKDIQSIIKEQAGDAVWDFIAPLLEETTDKTLLMATSTRFNILNQKPLAHDTLINLKRVNDVRYLNKFFEAINALLPEGGLYINSVQTYKIRKDRILNRFPIGINWFIYFFDVLFKRVFPKLPITKKDLFLCYSGK